MVPETTTRVPQHTAEHINRCIRAQSEANIAGYAAAGPEAIDQRLKELDREWDIECTLEANGSTLALIGVVLAATVSPWWLLLPGVVTAFLLQHGRSGLVPTGAGISAPRFSHSDRDRLRVLCAQSPARGLPRVTQGRDQAAAHELLLAMQR